MQENLVENVVPSKPFENYQDIENLAVKAKGRVERIQVDICDGLYVKNVSWPFTEISKKDFTTWGSTEIKENAGLRDLFMPEAYDLNYTADLMCLNPEKYIDTLAAYGFDEIIVHFRSLTGGESAQEQLETIFVQCEKYDLKLYLAVDMKSNFSEFTHMVQDFLNSRDRNWQNYFIGVQVMGIENIGQQAQDFVPETLELVKKIKAEFPNLKILFDGGINEENLLQIKNAGVDIFCVGHLLTDGDFVDNLRYIKKLLN